MQTKRSNNKPVHFRVLVGSTFLNLFAEEADFLRLETALKSGKDTWFNLKTSAGEKVQLRLPHVFMIELTKEKNASLPEGTIPIKRLATFAGVHPITITRLFPATLKQTSEGSRTFRRATKETAMKLREHLLKSSKASIKPERDFLKLFE